LKEEKLTVKAIVQTAYGSPEVLSLGEVPKPEVGAGEVLIRVVAASVDWRVWHFVTGTPYLMRLMGVGLRAPKNLVPRADVAGRVEAVGAGVTAFSVGDEVYGTCNGAFAEYAVVQEDMLAAKPVKLSFEEAAAVPYSGFAALQGLRDRAHLEPGQKVLVVGASGAIGVFGVQLAKAFGAEVTGVCGASSVDLVRALGADHVINYTREDFSTTGRYDVILDVGGRSAVSRLRRALARTGTLVMIGGEGGGRWVGMGRQIRAQLWSLFVRQRMGTFLAKENAADLLVLNELIEGGRLMPHVAATVPLKDTADALHRVELGHTQGRLIVMP
jgi:NADPH:quinone reductase-like Zn-dependent oxidoreductase